MRFSDLEGARIGVWGAGREIASLARQVQRRLPSAAIEVAIFDGPPPADAAAVLRSPGVRIARAGDAADALRGADVLVRSPGVSIHRPELAAVGVPVTTATSLWLSEAGGAGVVAVTGTKGKSTTAALLAHLAAQAGVEVRLAGNIGAPALDLLDGPSPQLTVLELSSYQIADLESGPETVLLTNLNSEHADWHGSVGAYRREKMRILRLPGVERIIFNGRDELLRQACAGLAAVPYAVPEGWDLSGGSVVLAGRAVLSEVDLPLPGQHNALNLCGALAALQALSIPLPSLERALAGFSALPHRLETVAVAGGVTWVDDSISTTPESAIAALRSFPGRRLVLIGGGQDRGQDHSLLAAVLAETGASVVGVPSTGPRLIADALAAGVAGERALHAPDLPSAVELAARLAGGDAVVLLSPAAPSYDHHRDFEQRGERFAQLARAAAVNG